MTFKEIANRDVSLTFLNMDEFAESHLVNGKEMHIVLDDVVQEVSKSAKSNMDGLYTHQSIMRVGMEEYGGIPARDSIVTIDRNTYLVIDVADERGVLVITLEKRKSR